VRKSQTVSWIASASSLLYPPSATAVIVDCVNGATIGLLTGTTIGSCGGTTANAAPMPPHSSSGNVAFHDGHATGLPWIQAVRTNNNTWIWDW
jgi:prepilin-type processing-associated H-X9-DG protein